MQKATLEKILEYASMPVHGTLSRKIRKDVQVQMNEGPVLDEAVFFLGEAFIRVTEEKSGNVTNTYYDWASIASVRTFSKKTT